jgi:hypothetical protein
MIEYKFTVPPADALKLLSGIHRPRRLDKPASVVQFVRCTFSGLCRHRLVLASSDATAVVIVLAIISAAGENHFNFCDGINLT